MSKPRNNFNHTADTIFMNWQNGNRTTAANAIRKCNKAESIMLIVCWTDFNVMMNALIGNRNLAVEWEAFVLAAVEGYYV